MACFLSVPGLKLIQGGVLFKVKSTDHIFCIILFHRNFVEEKLGAKYVERTRLDLVKAFEESSPDTPVFFVLSPGVDALKDLETLGEWPGGSLACPPACLPTWGPPTLPFSSQLSSFLPPPPHPLLEIECVENVSLITLQTEEMFK